MSLIRTTLRILSNSEVTSSMLGRSLGSWAQHLFARSMTWTTKDFETTNDEFHIQFIAVCLWLVDASKTDCLPYERSWRGIESFSGQWMAQWRRPAELATARFSTSSIHQQRRDCNCLPVNIKLWIRYLKHKMRTSSQFTPDSGYWVWTRVTLSDTTAQALQNVCPHWHGMECIDVWYLAFCLRFMTSLVESPDLWNLLARWLNGIRIWKFKAYALRHIPQYELIAVWPYQDVPSWNGDIFIKIISKIGPRRLQCDELPQYNTEAAPPDYFNSVCADLHQLNLTHAGLYLRQRDYIMHLGLQACATVIGCVEFLTVNHDDQDES